MNEMRLSVCKGEPKGLWSSTSVYYYTCNIRIYAESGCKGHSLQSVPVLLVHC